MPRAKRKEVTPLDSGFFVLDGEDWQFLVYENLADHGGRGIHMRSKRSKAFDKVLLHCEKMLSSDTRYQRTSFERHTSGLSKVSDFATAIGPIIRPLIIGKTLKTDIVQMVRAHYSAVKAAQKELVAKKESP